jgi:hypothetical protein
MHAGRASLDRARQLHSAGCQVGIDDYAENETGSREYFWNRPHKAG